MATISWTLVVKSCVIDERRFELLVVGAERSVLMSVGWVDLVVDGGGGC